MNIDDSPSIVRKFLSEEFKDADIERIDFAEDQDFDGDPVYRVLVVVKRPERLDGGRMAGIVRHLRNLIDPDPTFPLVSFRSSGDDKQVRAEAA